MVRMSLTDSLGSHITEINNFVTFEKKRQLFYTNSTAPLVVQMGFFLGNRF